MATKTPAPSRPGHLYELGSIHSHPCGCVFQVLQDGYHLYTNPTCKAQHGPAIKGYEIAPWSAAPAAVKKAYGWLVEPKGGTR